MGAIPCRAPGCDALRSDSVTSTDGDHIPSCHKCGDEAYIDTWYKDLSPEEKLIWDESEFNSPEFEKLRKKVEVKYAGYKSN